MGAGFVVALIVLVLCIVLMALGQLDVKVGALIFGLAVARLL